MVMKNKTYSGLLSPKRNFQPQSVFIGISWKAAQKSTGLLESLPPGKKRSPVRDRNAREEAKDARIVDSDHGSLCVGRAGWN